MTELADTLTREHGLPFVRSHAIAAGLIEAHRAAPERPLREHAGRRVDAGHRRPSIDSERRGCGRSCARATSSASARRSAARRRRTARAVRDADAALAETRLDRRGAGALAAADRARRAALEAL